MSAVATANLVGITGGGEAKRLPFSGNFDQHAIKPISASVSAGLNAPKPWPAKRASTASTVSPGSRSAVSCAIASASAKPSMGPGRRSFRPRANRG